LLAASASAQAGITIPAGDWTLDVNGNVNVYVTSNSTDRANGTVTGGVASVRDANNESRSYGINTGLLPAWLGFSGKTRSNDLDVGFTISVQPGVSDNGAAGSAATTPEWRQAFLTFGDASWGSIKMGKDLGIFASDAILNDMTLLGVGSAPSGAPGGVNVGSGSTTSYGGIGTGYIYAAWKGQVAYTSPNWNGFQFTAGVTNPNQGFDVAAVSQDRLGLEGKASYAWTGDVSGKVWVSGASYKVTALESTYTADNDIRVTAIDIGANVNVGDFGLTAYYYDTNNGGTTVLGGTSFVAVGNKLKGRDSDGGYVQATYTLPTKTKLGVAYGVSNLDKASGRTAAQEATIVDKNDRITIGAYHPLTKNLNLVAEYNKIESEGHGSGNNTENKSVSLGAILFF